MFADWLRLEGLSQRTINDYLYVLSKFPFEDLTQETANIFLSTHRRSVDRAFVKNYRDFLAWRFPDREESYIKIKMPKQRGRKKRVLPDYPSEDEVHKIEKQFDKNREKILLLLSFYSALRPQGVLKLKKADFYFDEWLKDESKACKLKVNEKGNKDRIIFVPANVMKIMKKPLLNSTLDAKLFGIGYKRWYHLLTEASKKAVGRPISPHKLRHAGATWLLDNNWSLYEVSEFLGHASISTTQIYAHLDRKKMEDKYNALAKNNYSDTDFIEENSDQSGYSGEDSEPIIDENLLPEESKINEGEDPTDNKLQEQ